MAKKVESTTLGNSTTDSTSLIEGSNQDPIMLSDDESIGAESKTDYSDLNIDPRAKSNSGPPHPDSEPADGNGFGPGTRTTRVSSSLAADYPDNGNKSNNGVVNETQLRFSANRPGSAPPSYYSVIHRARKLQVNIDITQGSTSYFNLDITKDLEDREYSVSAKECDKDDDNTCPTKRSKSSAISSDNPAFDGNLSGLYDSQPDAQSLPPGPAAASLHRSDSKNDHLRKQIRRRGTTGNVHYKRTRTPAPTRLASISSTVCAAPGSADVEQAQPRALTAAPVQERDLRDIELEMVDNGGTDHSSDGDYANGSDATGSHIRDRPGSRKRMRRAKDTEDVDVAAPSHNSLGTSYQAATATSSGVMHESEEIPVHGYLTLKMVQSQVVYSLTFSQELLPRPRDRRQRQVTTTDLKETQSVAPVAEPNHQWGIRKIIGQKMVSCERHYRVAWKDTWMPESELAGAKELVDAFIANGGNGISRKRPLNRGVLATGQPVALGEEEPKKRRGRPRKQT